MSFSELAQGLPRFPLRRKEAKQVGVDAKTGILRSHQYRPVIAGINLCQAPAAKFWWDRAQGSLQPNLGFGVQRNGRSS
jgi:hypothetical protein